MAAEPRLDVVLLWHMHQPDYRVDGRFTQPWVYLHGIKDYVDMAWHLEATPEARAVVNFVPVLLEQIEAYVASIDDFLRDGEPLCDPRLAFLAEPRPTNPALAMEQTKGCLDVHALHVLGRYPAFARLAAVARALDVGTVTYLSEQFFADLATWFHLAWLGETIKRENTLAQRLIRKGAGFSVDDRRALLALIGEALGSVLPRYRALAASGRVELSMTPYAHPILPLMIDFDSALEPQPDLVLPKARGYPGGRERAEWHVDQGKAVFERVFGFEPKGCWPSEGAVSAESLALLSDAGFTWTASGGGVLGNSLARSGGTRVHAAYRYRELPMRCFFRDDGLSDLIGFDYQAWPAADAVGDLIGHLETIAADPFHVTCCIALDGENAWEHYPENGFAFLSALYGELSSHSYLTLGTLSDAVTVAHSQPVPLEVLVSGSWVHGTLDTWIGETSKNRAWTLLIDAKRAFDRRIGDLDDEQRRVAERQLAIAEGSDGFWWFGGANPIAAVERFDALLRSHLRTLYRILELDAPAALERPFATSSDGSDGSMRRST